MKATVKTKNPYTFPTYTVMIGKEIIKAFYFKTFIQIDKFGICIANN